MIKMTSMKNSHVIKGDDLLGKMRTTKKQSINDVLLDTLCSSVLISI